MVRTNGSPTPYGFRSSQEIIDLLTSKKDKLEKEFRQQSLKQMVKLRVGTNTFRAFRGLTKKPSVVFQGWAATALDDKNTIKELTGMQSQASYDIWLKAFSSDLSVMWRKKMGEPLAYGASRKLPNLLLKGFVRWTGLELSEKQRNRLISFLHVPLDSYTLFAIRKCAQDLRIKIPANATMRFVANQSMYDQIQGAIRAVTDKATVPAI